MACGSERPAITRNSSTLSNVAVSLPPSRMIGRIFWRSSPKRSDGHQRFARLHPVDVAAQRVDLAVVRDEPVRMRQRPRRKGVRAEPLVDERERRLHARIVQIGKHPVDLVRDEHALVDQGPRRQADDVEGTRPRNRQRVDSVLHALADDVELALEGRVALGDAPGAGSPAPRPMNTCLKTGSTATALGPIWPSSVGTSRQPIRRCPSSFDDALEERLSLAARTTPRAAGTRVPHRIRARAAAPCRDERPRPGGTRPASE